MPKLTNNWLANMPTNTIKGNDTGGSAVPKDLTGQEVIDLLGISVIEPAQLIAVPIVELPSTIVRDPVDATIPELLYEYDSAGDLDVVSYLETISS